MNVKPATAKISSLALKHNLQVIKEKAPHSKIIAVVKANAYGHGVVFVSSALESMVDCFADRKSTRLNSSHESPSRMPSSA